MKADEAEQPGWGKWYIAAQGGSSRLVLAYSCQTRTRTYMFRSQHCRALVISHSCVKQRNAGYRRRHRGHQEFRKQQLMKKGARADVGRRHVRRRMSCGGYVSATGSSSKAAAAYMRACYLPRVSTDRAYVCMHASRKGGRAPPILPLSKRMFECTAQPGPSPIEEAGAEQTCAPDVGGSGYHPPKYHGFCSAFRNRPAGQSEKQLDVVA